MTAAEGVTTTLPPVADPGSRERKVSAPWVAGFQGVPRAPLAGRGSLLPLELAIELGRPISDLCSNLLDTGAWIQEKPLRSLDPNRVHMLPECSAGIVPEHVGQAGPRSAQRRT